MAAMLVMFLVLLSITVFVGTGKRDPITVPNWKSGCFTYIDRSGFFLFDF
jgi:hypothetical protein